jgi:hypothetical protein
MQHNPAWHRLVTFDLRERRVEMVARRKWVMVGGYGLL